MAPGNGVITRAQLAKVMKHMEQIKIILREAGIKGFNEFYFETLNQKEKRKYIIDGLCKYWGCTIADFEGMKKARVRYTGIKKSEDRTMFDRKRFFVYFLKEFTDAPHKEIADILKYRKCNNTIGLYKQLKEELSSDYDGYASIKKEYKKILNHLMIKQ